MKLLAKISLFLALFWGLAYCIESPQAPIPTPPLPQKVEAVSVAPIISIDTSTTTEMIGLTNQDREASGWEPLSENQILMQDAQVRAEFFCHEPFGHFVGGKTPWDFFTGYTYNYAGENLGWGYANTQQLETAFINSSEHRDNIMNPHYGDIGVGWACGVTVVLFGSQY